MPTMSRAAVLCVVVALVAGAIAAEETAGPVTALRIYSNEFQAGVFERVTYGYDRDQLCTVNYDSCSQDTDCDGLNPNDVCGVPLDTLVPGTPLDIWDLVCDPVTPGGTDCQADAWDFSAVNPTNFSDLVEVASTVTPIDPTETCSFDQCGFTTPGATLGREDRGFATANPVPTLNAMEFEDRAPQDHTIWIRAAVRNEGVSSGGLGLSESRICYVGDDRTEVPLWQFQNCDGQGCYMQVGDLWEPEDPVTGAPQAFQCEEDLFNHVCPSNCGLFCALFAYSCGDFAGKQISEVVNEGLVTLPSGHAFKALVARSNAEFCVGLFSSCGNATQRVRTVIYLWEVRHIGTVARLQSRTQAVSVLDFNTDNGDQDVVSETDIKFGLFPPLTLTVDAITDTTVDLSWDPGLITDRIDGYRIYWDTDSGASSTYAFDSVNNAGQVSFSETSATISGLTAGTIYFFTVNSVSDFQDPSSGVTTTYESTMFPKQIPAVPVDLPLEVSAATSGGGGPAGAVPDGDEIPGSQLLLERAGASLELTWGDSCLAGDNDFGVYEGDLGSFSSHVPVVCTTSGSTSTAIVPSGGDRYYLVVPSNPAAEGSYGRDSGEVERPASGSACSPQVIGAPICP